MSHSEDKLPHQFKVPKIHYKIMKHYPHNPRAFTEGLEFHDGCLYESTGGEAEAGDDPSSLRLVRLDTGEVMQMVEDKVHYLEGLTILDGQVFQLTEKSGVGFIYDSRNLLAPRREFAYDGWKLGWGITNDGKQLILGDSTDKLFFVDPNSLKVVGKPINVSMDGKSLAGLNELEYMKGSIYANVEKNSSFGSTPMTEWSPDGSMSAHYDPREHA